MDFVSRAGRKLQFAIDSFEISLKNKVAADFGSSTGGFTDCLLYYGAKKVYAVDTAYGELAWKLRKNPRVVVMERTNAMHIQLPFRVDLITIDVGWTKQKHILPNALVNLKPEGKIISLIKPHYEAGKASLTDEEIISVLNRVKEDIRNCGLEIIKLVESPLLGEKGKNKEYLAFIEKLPSNFRV